MPRMNFGEIKDRLSSLEEDFEAAVDDEEDDDEDDDDDVNDEENNRLDFGNR